MSVIDRYKKPGGFLQLLTLLETCGQAKREKFLQMIIEENPQWHTALKPRLLTVEILLNWPTEYLNEITSRALPITIAAISKGLTEEQNKKLLFGLSHSQLAKIREISENKTFAQSEITASNEKLLSETRDLIQKGTIKLEKFAPELTVPSDLEEQLAKSSTIEVKPLATHSPNDLNHEQADKLTQPNYGLVNHVVTNIPQSNDDLTVLRKQNFQMQQELLHLRNENHLLKDKLEKIKRIA